MLSFKWLWFGKWCDFVNRWWERGKLCYAAQRDNQINIILHSSFDASVYNWNWINITISVSSLRVLNES